MRYSMPFSPLFVGAESSIRCREVTLLISSRLALSLRLGIGEIRRGGKSAMVASANASAPAGIFTSARRFGTLPITTLTVCGGFTLSPKKNSASGHPRLPWPGGSRVPWQPGIACRPEGAAVWPSGSAKRAWPLPSSPSSASP